MKYLLTGCETARIQFRPISVQDFEAWLPFFHDQASHAHWLAERGTAEEECRKWYARQADRYKNNEGGMNVLVDNASGQLIGHAGLLLQEVDGVKEIEIAYSLLPAYWNRGYATEAALACRDAAFFRAFTDSLISIISLTNEPSANVARKLGMQPEKQTVYNGNAVNIFRLHKTDWSVRI